MVRYILQMSDGRFLGKDLDWTNCIKKTALSLFEHQDQALNKLVELNAKDINLRAKVMACEIKSQNTVVLADIKSAAA